MKTRNVLRGVGGVTTRDDLASGGQADRIYATGGNPYVVVDVVDTSNKAYYQLSNDALVNLTSRAAADGIVPFAGTSAIDVQGFAYITFWAPADVADHLEVHRAQ